VSLAGRAGDRLSERVLERAGAAWEEQRGQRILISSAVAGGCLLALLNILTFWWRAHIYRRTLVK
jgi:hypothetical protein